MKRTVFRVYNREVPQRDGTRPRLWIVQVNGAAIAACRMKRNAERFAAERAECLMFDGIPSQVVVHTREGRISHEWTYPDASPHRKG